MTTFCTKLATLGILFLTLCTRGYALPPLGLTQVSADSTLRPNLELIDGTAYLGVSDGIWIVDTSGSQTFTPISHPALGDPSSVTRVVKATDGVLYAAANFSFFTQPAIYRLDAASSPIITWENGLAAGVDVQLRTFGYTQTGTGSEASRFLLDGSIQALSYPPDVDSPVKTKSTRVDFVTPSGYAVGWSVIPGTIGAAPAQWTPEGGFSFILGNGVVTSSRDRADGQGINTGFFDYDPTARLGDDYYFIEGMNGERFAGDGEVLVSHSDFAVVQDWSFPADRPKYAFYPGIVPGFPNRAAPLLDIFPELAAIDIDQVHDLASVDGYLYMTLSGSDGTFLFGARDPSAVPEPASVALAALYLLVGTCAPVRSRRFAWLLRKDR